MKRRRLTHIERNEFIQRAAQLIVVNGLTNSDALMRAGAVLPEEKRQLKYKNLKVAYRSWLDASLEVEIEKLRSTMAQKATTPITPEPTKQEEPKQEEPKQEEPKQVASLSSFATEDLVREVMMRIITNVTTTFTTSIQRSIQDVQKTMAAQITIPANKETSLPEPTPDPAKKKLRIGIVGLFPNQEQIIKKEFGNEIDLRFLRQQGNDLKFFGDYFHIVGMRGAMSHAHTEKIKSMKMKYTLCSGMTDMRNALTELWVQHG